jgi:hypothetical protein
MIRPIKKSIRLSEDENKQINSLIENHNISFSDFARSKILNQKIKTNLSKDLIYEVRKIGTNLNQIAHHVNQSKSVDFQVLEKLVSIEKQLEELRKNVN